jgi:hypothetical protein
MALHATLASDRGARKGPGRGGDGVLRTVWGGLAAFRHFFSQEHHAS